MNQIQCEVISWDSAVALCYELAEQVKASQFEPDLIIAIARGAYVPARVLCDYLAINDLASIRIEHYTDVAKTSPEAKITISLDIDLSQRRVLLVDDVDDTGDTLVTACNYLKMREPALLKTAVLHHKSCSHLMPDYYASEQSDWRWITYPWAVSEDVRGFVDTLTTKPTSLDELQNALQQQFDFRVSRQQLERIHQLSPLYDP